MNTIRIPTRYKKTISRFTDKERAWILNSLFLLADGEDVQILDSFAGDTLEQIWRDSVMMEKKNKHNADFIGGDCVPSNDAVTTGCEVKGSEVKGREYIFPTEKFEEFWNAYNRKKEKPKAIEQWKKLRIDDSLADEIIIAAKKYAENTEKKFRKYPERWLKALRWNDDVEEKLRLDNIKTVEELDRFLKNASDRDNNNASVALPELYLQSKYCRI